MILAYLDCHLTISRICFKASSSAMVRSAIVTKQDWVSHSSVDRRHIDLSSQTVGLGSGLTLEQRFEESFVLLRSLSSALGLSPRHAFSLGGIVNTLDPHH
jgi:hypothetical protein